MSCHDHRPWQYASRGGGFDLPIADFGRNELAHPAGGGRCRYGCWPGAGGLAEGSEQPRNHDREGYRDHCCNDRNLQDAQAA